MGVKILIFVVSLAVLLQYIHAAPSAKPVDLESKEQRQLIDSFVQFLEQDSILHDALENNLGRNKRDTGAAGDDIDDNYDTQQPSKPGFFDKAAKFVTELLQRFLKWINEDNK